MDSISLLDVLSYSPLDSYGPESFYLPSPVLVGLRNSDNQEFLTLLTQCINQTNRQLYIVDARQIVGYPDNISVDIYPLTNINYKYLSSLRELDKIFTSSSSSSSSTAMNNSCILIEHIDQVIDEITCLCRSMQTDKLLYDYAKSLKSLIDKIHHMNTTQYTISNKMNDMNFNQSQDVHINNCIILVTSTIYMKLPNCIRQLFVTSIIHTGDVSPFDAINTNQNKKDINGGQCTTPMYSKSALNTLQKHMKNISPSHFTQMAQLEILGRNKRQLWTKYLDYSPETYTHLSSSTSINRPLSPNTRTHVSTCTPSSSVYNNNGNSSNSSNNDNERLDTSISENQIYSILECMPSKYKKTLIANKNNGNSDVNIAPVYWEDIGGLENARKEILDVIQLPLLYPHLFPPGCPRRRGLLLYGPPGTGKTLVAKAVATECKMAFLSVKGPELLDMYVGESERNVRELFDTAKDLSPCILFFDEIDSIAPARGRGTDSGGVMDRVVSQLVTELDGLNQSTATTTTILSSSSRMSGSMNTQMSAENGVHVPPPPFSTANASSLFPSPDRLNPISTPPHRVNQNKVNNCNTNNTSSNMSKISDIYVIGATNRPDLLDSSLLTPGRFDKKVYLAPSKNIEAQVKIFKAQMRKYALDSDVNLVEICHLLPSVTTGADISDVTSKAYFYALQRKLKEIELLAQEKYGNTDNSKENHEICSEIHTQTTVLTPKKSETTSTPTSPRQADTNIVSYASTAHITTYVNTLPKSALMVKVCQQDLIEALKSLKPSVSLEEFKKYEDLTVSYEKNP